jgi:hypothetical protein
MSSFTEPLEVTILQKEEEGRIIASLLIPFDYYTDLNVLLPNNLITVPKGFETDFASVPRLFWSLFPPLGPYSKAAVVHDYLCTCKWVSSIEAAAIFHEAMLVLKVNRVTAFLLWLAVRLFGPKFKAGE